MKRCPNCNRTYTDEALNFCLEDGTPLVAAPPQLDNNETQRYISPSTNPYPPAAPSNPPRGPYVNQAPQHQGQWSPLPASAPQKKSTAIWWILGGLAVLAVIGVGVTVMIIAIASINSQSNTNRTSDANTNSNTNRNSNTNSNRLSNTNGRANANTNSTPLPASFTDDFSQRKWNASTSEYGRLWYDNDEYHMISKPKTFVEMYGPSNDYNTENATIKVTARNVDGTSPASGYGLVVHGERAKDNSLEDYAFIIFSGPNPQYKVVMHKGGEESKMVDWTASDVIRKGTATNQLEVRVSGEQLTFLINGQLMTVVNDTGGFKRGRAGLYSTDEHEVAFDDMEITR